MASELREIETACNQHGTGEKSDLYLFGFSEAYWSDPKVAAMPVQAIICAKCGNATQAIAKRVEFLDTGDALVGEYRVPYKVLYRVDCPQCGVGTQVSDVSVDAPRCPTPNCGSPFIHARGLCLACCNVYEDLVNQGVVTWQALEQHGIVQKC